MMTTHGETAQEALYALGKSPEAMDALRDAKWLRDQAEEVIGKQVRALRDEDTPWSVIGLVLGVSKQAAQQRYA